MGPDNVYFRIEIDTGFMPDGLRMPDMGSKFHPTKFRHTVGWCDISPLTEGNPKKLRNGDFRSYAARRPNTLL